MIEIRGQEQSAWTDETVTPDMTTAKGDIPPTNKQFDSLFDCFVINLQRQPERLKAFLTRNLLSGINFHHFEAVDGTQCNAADYVGRIVAPGSCHYTPGAIGAAMSHSALWRHCIEQNKPFIVFEDDAVVRQDFKAQLAYLTGEVSCWDFILLGYNTNSELQLSVAPGIDLGGTFSVHFSTAEDLAEFARARNPVGLPRLNLALGICGYAISPSGAEQLHRHCFPMDNRPVHLPWLGRIFPAYGIDCMMANVYKTMRAFVCTPPLVMTPNDQATSTIQSPAYNTGFLNIQL